MDITVTSAADSGAGTLRQAIADATAGDTILFDPEVFPAERTTTIELASELVIDKDLTIDGTNAAVCLYGVLPYDSTEFVRAATINANVVVKSLTFYGFGNNGDDTFGGGVYCVNVADGDNIAVLFENCVFRANRAGMGAGIFSSYGAETTLRNCEFERNYFEDVYARNLLVIENCVFGGEFGGEICLSGPATFIGKCNAKKIVFLTDENVDFVDAFVRAELGAFRSFTRFSGQGCVAFEKTDGISSVIADLNARFQASVFTPFATTGYGGTFLSWVALPGDVATGYDVQRSEDGATWTTDAANYWPDGVSPGDVAGGEVFKYRSNVSAPFWRVGVAGSDVSTPAVVNSQSSRLWLTYEATALNVEANSKYFNRGETPIFTARVQAGRDGPIIAPDDVLSIVYTAYESTLHLRNNAAWFPVDGHIDVPVPKTALLETLVPPTVDESWTTDEIGYNFRFEPNGRGTPLFINAGLYFVVFTILPYVGNAAPVVFECNVR